MSVHEGMDSLLKCIMADAYLYQEAPRHAEAQVPSPGS
jgi:hypothetical protein